MKKRFLAIALTVALLVTLVPFGTLEAKAASSFTASDELIAVLKKWEGFSKKPYWDYSQWTVGYGTAAPSEHLARYKSEGISEEEATQLLNNYLASKGKSVNSFIDKYGIEANQGMFDAMLSFTYNLGTSWMYQKGTIRTAVVDGWTGSDLVFAFGQWCKASEVILPGLIRRRLAEANIYLNGEYSSTAPSNYCYVIFDANGGSSEISVQGYDSTTPVAIRAVPTYDNHVFLGWYTDATGGDKVTALDSSVKGYKLYAHWGTGSDSSNSTQSTITGTTVDYVREVTAGKLSAFDSPEKGAMVVDAYDQYATLEIVAEYTDGSGVKWGKVKNGGWINLEYTQEPTVDDESNGVTVTVNANGVNIRRGPGTTYTSVGQVNKGDQLIITRTTTAGGYTWGKSRGGWIALKYTNYDEAVNDSIGSEGTEQTTVAGTVKVDDYLCIRSGAGTSNPVVGQLTNGARVEILEQKAVGGTIWGRIDKGWISLNYVVLDAEDKDDTTDDPVQDPETDTDTPGTDTETPGTDTDTPGTDTEQPGTGTDTPGTGADAPDTDTPDTDAPSEDIEMPAEPAKVMGTVKGNSLRIRTGASTGYGVVGYYNRGDRVEILEQKTVGATIWGRTDKGWISLDYVTLDETEEPGKNPEQTPEQEGSQDQDQTPEQDQETEQDKDTEQAPDSETAVSITGTIKLSSGKLNVRKGPGTGYGIVAYLSNGAKVEITEQKTVGTTVWGKMSKGWISMAYFIADEKPATVTGTVDVEGTLRVRSGPGTSYAISGYVADGAKVEILEQQVVGNYTWGRISKGWIRLDYVKLDGSASSSAAKTGTITTNGLRIRSAAGTSNKIVGSLDKGDKVTILETTVVSGSTWGRIADGWISMNYVKLNG